MAKTTTKAIKPTSTSPKKREGKRLTMVEKSKQMKQKQAKPELDVYNTHSDINKEFYIYSSDGSDCFTYAFKQFVQGNITCDRMMEANFTSWKFRRVAGSDNDHMKDTKVGKEFWRCVMIRDVPSGISTPETRAEGLSVLKWFFMTKPFTEYPPKDIIETDCANDKDPFALDQFLMDSDIIAIIKEEIDEEELNEEFFGKFTSLAKKLWGGRFYPDYASKLGFP